MEIKETEIRLFYRTASCSKCKGEMKFTGEAKTCFPPLHEHECDKCGNIEYSKEVFPNTIHKY